MESSSHHSSQWDHTSRSGLAQVPVFGPPWNPPVTTPASGTTPAGVDWHRCQCLVHHGILQSPLQPVGPHQQELTGTGASVWSTMESSSHHSSQWDHTSRSGLAQVPVFGPPWNPPVTTPASGTTPAGVDWHRCQCLVHHGILQSPLQPVGPHQQEWTGTGASVWSTMESSSHHSSQWDHTSRSGLAQVPVFGPPWNP